MKRKELTFAGYSLVLLVSLLSTAFAQGPPRLPGRASASPNASASQPIPDELLVGYLNASNVRAGAAGPHVPAALGHVEGAQQALSAYRVKLAPGIDRAAAAAYLQRQEGILYVEPNYIRHAYATPNDTAYANQYAPKIVSMEKAWDIWTPKSQVSIAVVDTGIDYSHPDLTGSLLRDSSGNVVGHNVQTGTASAQDDNGHGTHCAGIADARGNNSLGIAGLAGWNPAVTAGSYVKLMPVKVLDSTGAGTDANVADGIIWAADHGAKVISLSLGGPDYSNTLNNAVQYAWNAGCVIACAAGNDGVSTYDYPAAFDHVLSVAATNSSDGLTSWSNYGSWVNVAAPGSGIYSTLPVTGGELGNNYGSLSGTSMAAPHVAAEAAILFAQDPSLTNTQVNNLITTNVDTYSPYSTHSISASGGRIDVYKALVAAGGGKPSTPAPSAVTLSPTTVRGGGVANGTVTLTGAAPTGGITVTLSSTNNAIAQPPSTVFVQAGAQSATFSVQTSPVAATTSVTIKASTADGSASANLTVTPLLLSTLVLSTSSVQGGATLSGTLTLTGPAPTGGSTVSLASNNTSVVTVPATVSIVAGQSSVIFPVTTKAVSVPTSVVVTATLNGVARQATVTVNPAPVAHVSSLAVSPSTIRGGTNATATVTLSSAAPAGGTIVGFSSDNPSVIHLPASVTIPQGSSTATVQIATVPVGTQTTIHVTVAGGGSSSQATLTVVPPSPTVIDFNPNPAVSGSATQGTVVLNGPAPAGGLAVKLSTETPWLVTVPSQVVVPGGSDRATFAVTVAPGGYTAMAVIDATGGGVLLRMALIIFG